MHTTGDSATDLPGHSSKRSLSTESDLSQSTSSSTSDAESLSNGDSPCCSSNGTQMCADGCSGNCHFSCNDDFRQSGDCLCFAKTSSHKGCDGGCPHFNENGCEDETSYLATKLRFESQLLKDKLKGKKRIASNAFFLEVLDIIFSWMGLVDRAVIKLEKQDVMQDKLYTSKQLSQLQKVRYAKQMENFIKLEAQMKEVNEDYGQLLVEHGAQEKMIQPKMNQEFHDGFSQTESVAMVDVATPTIPEETSLSAQTELCVNVETQTDMALDEGSNHISQDLIVFTAEEDNGCKTQTQVNLCCEVDVVGNGCEEAMVTQTKDQEEASAADETQGISCLPDERTPNDEWPAPPETDGDQPLLCDHTREHAGEPNPAGPTSTITWPCDHYKRLCLVKFECCEQFYPCHRCHNASADCPTKKLKSINAKMLKCLSCNKVQNITEDSHHCCKCGIEFAKYFCGHCQHFTGMDDHPYHCTKCGICRIKSNISFHCDVCDVCLDVSLRNNHLCRKDSAHDDCCICLEDAFSGCQILPCSHKVHKQCAVMMIKNGVYKCPVCRESFAHKLQRVKKSETADDVLKQKMT